MAGETTIALADELFEVSGSSSFTGELDLPELRVGPDVFSFDGRLPWNVLVVNTGGGSLLVSGSISGSARVACARCLEEFELDLAGEVEGFIFLSQPDEAATEELDEDEYLVMPESHKVDIADFLKAALVLDVPLVPLHDDECLGLCPNCGENLNEGPCGCGELPADDDDFAVASNPFAALKDFKFDN